MQVRQEYAEKMKNAGSDEERGKLRAEMHERLKELRGGGSDASASTGSVPANDGPLKDEVSTSNNTTGKGRTSNKLKAAETKLMKNQNAMNRGTKAIENARSRLSRAKEKLQSDIDAGSLSKEDIMKREEKIRSVENQINILEAAVNKGKSVNANAGKRLNSLEKNEN